MTPLTLLKHRRAFKRRIEEFRPRLFRLACSWCHNPDLADDLVQETLLKALRNAHQLRDMEAFESWLFSILNNCWRDHFRRRREIEDIDNVVLIEEVTPSQLAEQQNIVDKVRSAVATLPAGQCQVLTLVDLEGLSYLEVADVLDIPIGTVMSRLCRARKALADRLLEFQPEQVQPPARLRRVK